MNPDETYRRLIRLPFAEVYELVYRYKATLEDDLDLPQIPISELEPYGWTEEEFREEMKNPHPELWSPGGLL